MSAIELDDPGLVERLRRMADGDGISLNQLVEVGLREYVRLWDQRQLERELAAFEAHRTEFEATYAGLWVAIRGGAVIDSDKDPLALQLRVNAQLGWWPVLYVEVAHGSHPGTPS